MSDFIQQFSIFMGIIFASAIVMFLISEFIGSDKKQPEPAPLVELPSDLEERDYSCYICCPDYCHCFKPPEDLPIAEECEEKMPCGDTRAEHFEGIPLSEVLDIGQIYETVAVREGVKCCPEGGTYWMAWIRSFENPTCCGIDQLVAFEKKPPKLFVYSLNGEIIEVYGNGLRNAG